MLTLLTENSLTDNILSILDQMDWPDARICTSQGRQVYEVGLEKIAAYQGDIRVLTSALDIFSSGDSRPYAFAGAAWTLVAASRQQDGTYCRTGLESAMEWLEEAQAMEPDIVEINVIEAFIYVYSDRLDDARVILDYLQEMDPGNYHVHLAEVAFWRRRQDPKEAVFWFEQAMDVAMTVPQSMRLVTKLADFYAECGMLDKALEKYREVAHFNKTDALPWHKMSLIYWRRENYEEAERCNRHALRLGELPGARKLEAALKKRHNGAGLKAILFGQ